MTNLFSRVPIFIALVGKGVFVFFYIIAALKYPGGSWLFRNQEGFSFWHNYLCDLLDVYAINGAINSARSFAIIALGFLVMGILALWLYLPKLFKIKNFNQKVMQISGLASLLTIPFLAFGNHDVVVRIAGVFGVIAFISCSIELYKTGRKILFLFGLLCILVFLINYYIYETGIFIQSLPVIQKITFVLFITWLVGLDLALYRKTMEPMANSS